MATRKIFLTAAFGLLFIFASAQENYKTIFSSDYEKAIRFLENEEVWMDKVILSYGLKPKEVKAVVFPELVRYSSLQDKIETFALESLYIQFGKDYANFSVGQFQIKPSFAENIEIDFLKMFGRPKSKTTSLIFNDTTQNQVNRSDRLKRIKDKKGMLNYICLFFVLMESKHPDWKNEEEKIKFFACAYNFDYHKSKDEITSFIPKKFFKAGLLSSTKYCYSAISWDYFQRQ